MSYAGEYPVAAYARPTERAAFIRNTYLHLAGAILAFVGVEAGLLHLIGSSQNPEQLRHLLLQPSTFMVIMLAFMAGGYLGNYWARSTASPALQYLGLGLYVVLQAVIFLPLMTIATVYSGDPSLIPKAGVMTLALFGGLTAAAFITRKDFSFLGPILCIGSFCVLGLIVASWMFGFQIGLWLSFVIVAISAASILYTTSNMMKYYSTNMHVAAALALFASVAQMFYHILLILLQTSRR